MAQRNSNDAARFDGYLDLLAKAIGHADRREPLRAYLAGLLLPGDRKSVEPMAARVDPRHVSSRHQSMHHLVASAPWSDQEVLARARDYALMAMERHAPVSAWIVDDTGIPKKGRASVGVTRQYCGILGKADNCQVAVTVSLANRTMSVPAAYRLYLPEDWAADDERRRRCGVPADIRFQPKWTIALDQIRAMVAEDLPRAPVIADAGYGDTTAFRDGITDLGLNYALAIKGQTTVWSDGKAPLAPKTWTGVGRPATLLRRSEECKPTSALGVARELSASHWKTVTWREGTRSSMSSRFARVRVRPAHRDYWQSEPRAEEWLLMEWPKDATEPRKYWLSTLPEHSSLEDLVQLVGLRWRIERDYEELKSEIGLDHFEGRGWRGFHHHGVLCIAAYCFLVAERARLSPPQVVAFLKAARVPRGFKPRGSPTTT